MPIKRLLQDSVKAFGYKIVRREIADPVMDADERFMRIHAACKDYTMTSKERMFALYTAVRYAIDASIPGDFVECGVWKGGSSMVIAATLLELGATDRTIHLYDTFEGMSEPTEEDTLMTDASMDTHERWTSDQKGEYNKWCYSPLDEVKRNLASTGYPMDRVRFVKGKVEDTIPAQIPETIALLRLDTDWYESTKHELEHLYPLLERQGVLIIDDYGNWAGSKKAVDEYFEGTPLLLSRVDYTGRMGIKTH